MKTIIVDDEPIAIKSLLKHLNDIRYIEVVGACENAMEALELLNSKSIDLMFLDINMPKITGIQFLKTLKTKPITIITSAYPEFALEGYELDLIDYLVKPIGFERFLKACNKAKDFFDLNHTEIKPESTDFIFIKCDKKMEKVYFDDIIYVEALHNYIAVVTENERLITYLTLKSIEDTLPKNKFLKVQKSFIVSIHRVKGIEDNEIIIKDKKISISRNNKDEIIKTILGNNYLKRV